jgi:hypothetical protein
MVIAGNSRPTRNSAKMGAGRHAGDYRPTGALPDPGFTTVEDHRIKLHELGAAACHYRNTAIKRSRRRGIIFLRTHHLARDYQCREHRPSERADAVRQTPIDCASSSAVCSFRSNINAVSSCRFGLTSPAHPTHRPLTPALTRARSRPCIRHPVLPRRSVEAQGLSSRLSEKWARGSGSSSDTVARTSPSTGSGAGVFAY